MRHTLYVPSVFFISLVTFSCGDDSDDSKSPSLAKQLTGTWASANCESSTSNGQTSYFKRTFTFTETTWAIDYSTFGSSDCADSGKLLTVNIGGNYTIEGASPSVTNANNGFFGFTTRTVTPRNQAIIDTFLKPASACGVTDWAVDKSQDIQTPGCAVLGAYPLATCTGEYDIIRLDGANLYFGVRPADGNLCTTALRPTALLPTAVVKQ
jgi:hypothetical protein